MTPSKERYPWRLGATSFVVPAGMNENAHFLSSLVDDVQLLFFESRVNSRLENPLDIGLLERLAGEHDLTYTAHLPIDLHLGSLSRRRRDEAIAEIIFLMSELTPLAPSCFDLHLLREPDMDESQWLDCLNSSLSNLADRLGTERVKIAIENIDYPFQSVRSLALGHGFSLCLDFGHGLRYGEDLEQMFNDIPRAVHVHYHGVAGGQDHLAVDSRQDVISFGLAEKMSDYCFSGVVTLEVYSMGRLQESCRTLAKVWKEYERK
ncbi:MAG: cobamide remodeling phosphodiesterase CbiR [Thermodesulfobacteriota bacterium]|nr:cobamide remodeling phosphodiesterase CbiR [Thermodesulfobacteriota bacterium]